MRDELVIDELDNRRIHLNQISNYLFGKLLQPIVIRLNQLSHGFFNLGVFDLITLQERARSICPPGPLGIG